MAVQEWSDKIRVVQLNDDPQFTEDLSGIEEDLDGRPTHVVLNFAAVGFINSSNVARLLRLRKKMLSIQKHMVLCEVSTQVWSIFLVTGLDKIFDFVKDVSTALAKVQLGKR
jgi:anti-anti-sigma factor